MDFAQGDEEADGGWAAEKLDHFFIAGSSCSEGEAEARVGQQKRRSARTDRGRSPPLLLAFSISKGQALQEGSRSPAPSSGSQEEEDELHIEEWMILGGEEQEGDSNIQLNLSYWATSSSSSSSEADDDADVNSEDDLWAVSQKDKCPNDQSQLSRYFVCGRSLTCHICNRTGHASRTCPIKRSPICVLCGVRGHNQRECPCRHCPSCGLPSHGLRPCEKPPIWNQHCRRCGMTGHLSDTCPDMWRQYHFTIQVEMPPRPQTFHNPRKRPAHCYNCSKRGHYGYECAKRRMVSGTFPSLPYVCHYDTMEDILQRRTRMQKKGKELASATSPSEQKHWLELTGESGEENSLLHVRTRRNNSSTGRRKTWPERRKERQEVKRLRREAQARREGGLLGRSRVHTDDDACSTHPLRFPCYGRGQSAEPPCKKKKKGDTGGKKCKKSREMERWKKRGGMKRGELYPYGDQNTGSKNLLSPKQRVRHRRR